MKEHAREVPPPGKTFPRCSVFLSVILFGLVVWTFLPSLRCGFIEFDDSAYVTANAHVNSGLSPTNIAWAFRSTGLAEWYPLTWLTLMLDCSLYGLRAWGFHLSNAWLHAINTVLVFLVLRQFTGASWRSAVVAALFGLHPLRVESVTWISERKDVLSALFWLLTLWAYGRYAREASGQTGEATNGRRPVLPAVSFYVLSLFFFALGLMSKSMVVTLPFVLLLLDYWPLGRFAGSSGNRGPRFKALIIEKAPFFALTILMSAVSYLFESRGGMTSQLSGLSIGDRVGNALVSYWRYVGKLFWPVDLCALYPHPGHWPGLSVLAAGFFVLGTSVLAWIGRYRHPWCWVGWMWYLGTLVPVIGVVQLSMQSMADRYTYLPSLGVLIAGVWALNDLTRNRHHSKVILSVLAGSAALICIVLTRQQIGHWKDGTTVWSRAIAVTQGNYDAHNRLGRALDAGGRTDEAVEHFYEAVKLKRDFVEPYVNLAGIDLRRGQVDEAIDRYRQALEFEPDSAMIRYLFAVALLQEGRVDEAIVHFQKATQIEPGNPVTRNNLGIALCQKGLFDDAIGEFRKALELRPDYPKAHVNLATILVQKGRLEEAITHFQQGLKDQPGDADTHNSLGGILLLTDHVDGAIREFKAALQLRADFAEASNGLALAIARKEAMRSQPAASVTP